MTEIQPYLDLNLETWITLKGWSPILTATNRSLQSKEELQSTSQVRLKKSRTAWCNLITGPLEITSKRRDSVERSTHVLKKTLTAMPGYKHLHQGCTGELL